MIKIIDMLNGSNSLINLKQISQIEINLVLYLIESPINSDLKFYLRWYFQLQNLKLNFHSRVTFYRGRFLWLKDTVAQLKWKLKEIYDTDSVPSIIFRFKY
jgi:hypothetical protein